MILNQTGEPARFDQDKYEERKTNLNNNKAISYA